MAMTNRNRRNVSNTKSLSPKSFFQKNVFSHVKPVTQTMLSNANRAKKMLVEQRKRFVDKREFNEAESFRRMNAERERKKIDEIHQRILRELGLNLRAVGSDRRFYAMSRALLEIFGEKISVEQIRNANNVLSRELSVNSPLLEQSPTLRNEIERMKYGRISEQGQRVLTQAVSDILERNEMI